MTPVTGEGLTYRHSVLLLAGVLLLWALGSTFFWCLVAVNPGEGEASSLTLRGSTIHEVGARAVHNSPVVIAEDARGEQASCNGTRSNLLGPPLSDELRRTPRHVEGDRT